MNASKTSQKNQKKKKQELRKGLLAFLKRLRAACKELDSLGDWEKFVQPLQDLLEKYADALSPAALQDLKAAIQIKDATKEGIDAACKFLDKELEKTILLLPVSASLATVLIGAVIVVAIAIPVAYAIIAGTARGLTITNTNCGDLQLYPGGLDFMGLHLPDKIANGSQATARVPGILAVDVDVEANGISFWLITEHHFTFSRQVQSATFNDASILGARTRLNFGSQPQNTLAITCQ